MTYVITVTPSSYCAYHEEDHKEPSDRKDPENCLFHHKPFLTGLSVRASSDTR